MCTRCIILRGRKKTCIRCKTRKSPCYHPVHSVGGAKSTAVVDPSVSALTPLLSIKVNPRVDLVGESIATTCGTRSTKRPIANYTLDDDDIEFREIEEMPRKTTGSSRVEVCPPHRAYVELVHWIPQRHLAKQSLSRQPSWDSNLSLLRQFPDTSRILASGFSFSMGGTSKAVLEDLRRDLAGICMEASSAKKTIDSVLERVSLIDGKLLSLLDGM